MLANAQGGNFSSISAVPRLSSLSLNVFNIVFMQLFYPANPIVTFEQFGTALIQQ